MEEKTKALFLVDGEHHPAAIIDAVRELERRLGVRAIGLYFLGGTEKIEDLSELDMPGVEVIAPGDPLQDLGPILRSMQPGLVLDLSDLPVIGPEARLGLAGRALAEGVTYKGSDFEFRPPQREKVLSKPSCSVIGTGKRCGKTAVSAEMARYLVRQGRRPVVVAMGRGGPAEPYVLQDRPITEDFLLSEMERGMHAASDNYEDALMAEVTTVGCRRCGGGMAGEPFVTNCLGGAKEADGLSADAVIMEGSGSSIPPVATNACVCVISAIQDLDEATGFLGPFRLLISDGVIITMAEEPFASSHKVRQLRERIKWINADAVVLSTILRPHPLKPIQGRKVFLVSTASEEAGALMEGYLREREECFLVGRSQALSNRRSLRQELERAVDAEILLTELKAAAVDTVADFARRMGKEIVYFHNIPVPIGEETGLERFFEKIWKKAIEDYDS